MRPTSLLALLISLTISSIPISSFATTPITVLRLIHDRDKVGGFDLSGDGMVDENDFFLLSLGWDPQDPGIFAPAPSPGGVPERTNQLTITISGTGEPFTFVELVNGLESTTTSVNGDGLFSVEASLNPNSLNRIFVSSVDYTGQRGTANPIEIIQDSQPPELHIDFPADGAELTNETVMIAGRVGDRLTGFMGLTVEVNGEPAQVDVGIGPNGTFERSGVPLAMGENTIEAIATDELGNSLTRQITLTRTPMTGPQMIAVSGDLQSGMIYSALPQPLVVKMTEADGVTPFPNKVVNFKVIRSDGRLTAAPGLPPASGSMLLQVRTDEQGMA
jgi:hypothetical protein